MTPPNASDIKVFVPAMNFGLSVEFYEAMGWKVNWRADDDSLAELELANCRLLPPELLQRRLGEQFHDAHYRERRTSVVGARVQGERG